MANWRHKVNIKSMFTDDYDNKENVLSICNVLIKQLETILNHDRKLLEKHDLDIDFEMIIDDFKFIKTSIEDKENSNKYEFETWTDVFNEYLAKLYDFGDMTVKKNDFWNDEKFLWIG